MIEAPHSFTVYLDGQEGHRGNVLLHAFLAKVHRLALVLNKLERAYLEVPQRQTDFEIVSAQKVNPTSLTLLPVPHVRGYNPGPAFCWSMEQIRTVSDDREPDNRVNFDIADDLVKLATHDSPTGYRAFWINGFAEKVLFDDEFKAKAARLAAKRKRAEVVTTSWHVGVSRGSVIGELKKVDDYEQDREFVIVPTVGAAAITCTFPDAMRTEMGKYLFSVVKVTGLLHYGASSPFPFKVETFEDGIELFPKQKPRRTLSEMRGVFSGRNLTEVNWGNLLDG